MTLQPTRDAGRNEAYDAAKRPESETLMGQVFKLFSTNHSPESLASCLRELMRCLPQIAAPQGLDYSSVFRVLNKSCIHFTQPDGRMIPFESHNLFYRDDRAVKLDALRAEPDGFHEKRKAISSTRDR